MTYPFPVRPWPDIIEFYEWLLDEGASFVAPMLSVARSVVVEGADSQIGGHTSMHDLVVTSLPVGSAVLLDQVRVALAPTPGPRAEFRLSRPGIVRISHYSGVGQDDEIERPASEVLPLFWRFMIEKYGVHPARDLA